MIAVEEVTIKTINFELDASVLYDIQSRAWGCYLTTAFYQLALISQSELLSFLRLCHLIQGQSHKPREKYKLVDLYHFCRAAYS
jgi:hypothetical protein